jgi:4'-phosphopantetheinyl transferase
MTHIFYAFINKKNHNRLLAEATSVFSKEYQERIYRYRRWEDMQLSLLGRFLLVLGLKALDCVFKEENLKYSAYDKPYFEHENLKFNISHSGEVVICAISDTDEIGVDIEILQDINIEDYRFQMTDIEWQRIVFAANVKNSFFDYWTQKEAVIKANGMGFSIPLKSFEINNGQTCINDELFFLKEIKLDRMYKCHLAIKNRSNTTILDPQLIDSFESCCHL